MVDTRSTKRKILHHAVERLTQVSAPLTGLVLYGSSGITYGYGYSYAYAENDIAAEGAPGPRVNAPA